MTSQSSLSIRSRGEGELLANAVAEREMKSKSGSGKKKDSHDVLLRHHLDFPLLSVSFGLGLTPQLCSARRSSAAAEHHREDNLM